MEFPLVIAKQTGWGVAMMNRYRCMAIMMFLLSLLSVCPSVWAEMRTFAAEGEYVMGEGETMEVAGEKARKNAIRAAAEEAGAFIRSFTKVQNLVLQEDVIEVVANHAMKVTVLDEQTDLVGKKSVRFRTRIRATISSTEIEANIKKAQEDRTVVDAHRKLQEDYARLARETEDLKKKLQDASAGERKDILVKIGTEEIRFKANVLYEKGTRLFTETDDLNGADEALTQSIILNPGFAQAYALRAQVRGARDWQKLDPALADMERAIALEPKNAEFYMKRAQIHRGWHRTGCERNNRTTCDRVFADMDRAIALEPENAWFHYYKGDLLAELERFDEAVAEVDQALRINSGTFTSGYGVVTAYMKRAQVQREKGNIAAAIIDLDKAVRISDTSQFFTVENRRIMETLKKVYQGEGMGGTVDEQRRVRILAAFGIPQTSADKEFPALHKMIEDSMVKLVLVVETYTMRADLHLEMEQYAKAKKDMRMACRWDTLTPNPFDRVALCQSQRLEKDLEQTYSPAGRWLKRGQRIAQEWFFGGDAKRKPETIRKALDAYGKAIALDPRYAEAWEARCDLLPKSEENPWNNKHLRERIIADCSQALRLNGNLLLARMDLAEAYRHMGQKEKALEEYGKVLQAHPEAGGAKEWRITLLHELGRLPEAIIEVDVYLRQNPNDDGMLREKAGLCAEAGRLPEALQAWEAYLRFWTALDQRTKGPGETESEQTSNARENIRLLKEKIQALVEKKSCKK